MQKANSNYNPDKRVQGNDGKGSPAYGSDIYNITKPSQSFSEQLVSAQLAADSSSIAANLRPPIPNIGKTAPRFGYRTTTPGIREILGMGIDVPSGFGDWSGQVGGYQGTSFPSIPTM